MRRFAFVLANACFAATALANVSVVSSVSWFIDLENDFLISTNQPDPLISETLFQKASPSGVDREGKAYVNLYTGQLKAMMATHNYGMRGLIDADATATDTFWIEPAGAGTSAEAILSLHVEGSITLNPNTNDGNGNVGLNAQIYGNNVDYKYPFFGAAELTLDKQPGQPIQPSSYTLTEGVDYVMTGNTAVIDTTITASHTFLVGDEPLPIHWSLGVGGGTGALNDDPNRRTWVGGDFWGTATLGIELAPGYEDFRLMRESGLPEPTTLALLAIGVAATIRRRRG